MYGIDVGNQQFTVRNITVNNAATAIHATWNWGWAFQDVTINNCGVGVNLTTGGITKDTQTVGSESIVGASLQSPPFLAFPCTDFPCLMFVLRYNRHKHADLPADYYCTDLHAWWLHRPREPETFKCTQGSRRWCRNDCSRWWFPDDSPMDSGQRLFWVFIHCILQASKPHSSY